jgi:hypothetical protein
VGFAELLEMADAAQLERQGGAVTYTSSEGEEVEVEGIFDKTHQHIDAGRTGVTSSGPVVYLRLSDLSSDPEEDGEATVTVAEVEYTIREVQKDGMGMVRLLLHKATA